MRKIIVVTAFLAGCVSVYVDEGFYVATAYDSSAKELQHIQVITDRGTPLYSARNALCKNNPGATVKIYNKTTNKEFETPYQCR